MNYSLINRLNRCCVGICGGFWLFLAAAFAAAVPAAASEFEYIFWGKISAQNLRLSEEEFHLSRSMRPAANWREYEPSCSVDISSSGAKNGGCPESAGGAGGANSAGAGARLAGARPAADSAAVADSADGDSPAARFRARIAADEPIFRALAANKPALIECAKSAQVRHKTTAKRLAAATSTRLALLPFRFRAEQGAAGKITIYARKTP